jgi:CRISPR-associated protein Csd1
MSVFGSLIRAYERLGHEVPPFGYSVEKIGFEIPLYLDGTLAGVPIDRRQGEGKKKTPFPMRVPQPAKRTSGVAPNFLWDKTSYALGISGKAEKRTADEHAAFVARHQELLQGSNDEGLQAFLRFLETWHPEDFATIEWPTDIKEQIVDQNVVFSLENERRRQIRIHDRPAAQELWARLCSEAEKSQAACLVTGEHSAIARLHPAIKGVWGAQSSGASIVSFNLDAFTSYGHEQGDNAPVSETAAFKYTTALNRFLERDSSHRIQIGDASTVFWADASDAAVATEAEDIFASLFTVNEKVEAKKVGAILAAVRQGKPIAGFKPDLPQGVRFYVLGLSPNAARVSVRFFIEDDFGEIATRYLSHIARMRIDPPPKEQTPSIWRLLIETAMQRKSENILPNLTGEWLRAVLTGVPYPLTLLSTLLMRLRADHDVNGLRAGLLKAVLICNFGMEVPVPLDPENSDPGYLLGRLFATYEYAQTQALGGNVNATIRDQYYGTASATPRAIFPLLQRKATHHLSRLRKDKPGLAINLDRRIGEIFELVGPESLFTPTLSAQRQALFAIGYYHQKNDFYRRKDDAVERTNQE